MDLSISLVEIKQIQGDGLFSPMAGQVVRTRGVVTCILHRGFYLQTPGAVWDGDHPDAIFVYSQDWRPDLGQYLEVCGEVIDYLKHDLAKPVTQLHFEQARSLALPVTSNLSDVLQPILLRPEWFPADDNPAVARRLNALEGMLVECPAGMTFIAPSNPFGDYVLAFDAEQSDDVRTAHGGVLIDGRNPDRWYPGFRVYDYRHARRLNVGATLRSPVRGALHYRVDAWQIASNFPFEIDPAEVEHSITSLAPAAGSVTIMTLNCFNLDPHVESADRVLNPSQDIDDDWGDGRFHSLARAIVEQARCPDIVALQEIQDSDGAEHTEVTDAGDTYALLIKSIAQISPVRYKWVDIKPELGADGGQPGGNIRNGYLYNPERVTLEPDSIFVLGKDTEAFIDSRKPLVACFRERVSGERIVCVNIHLASKRHQNSIFAPRDPGVDAKLDIRIEQGRLIRDFAESQLASGREVYITGDFNDTEHSDTLRVMTSRGLQNLVLRLPEQERYDYNHRGKLQVLMHGLVSRAMAEHGAEYEILHGNELIGVQPGEISDKPSDHAYVIARLKLST